MIAPILIDCGVGSWLRCGRNFGTYHCETVIKSYSQSYEQTYSEALVLLTVSIASCSADAIYDGCLGKTWDRCWGGSAGRLPQFPNFGDSGRQALASVDRESCPSDSDLSEGKLSTLHQPHNARV
jgi:hypothetical protein